MQEFGLTAESLDAPGKTAGAPKAKPRPARDSKRSTGKRKKLEFTHRQGQFLAFIHLYRKLHRRGPAELDMVRSFRVTPPSVHGMIVTLEQRGLVTREAGVPRSVRIAIPEDEVPRLETVEGPAN